jgi:soluble lytic murein transglycosylase-like protein
MEQQRAAAAIQRESVRKQAELAVQLPPLRPKEVTADCDPIPDPYASVLLGIAATSQHVDPKLLRGVILQESGFRPCAVSSKGALGLMQLMPATVEQFQVSDPFDPRQNVEAGAKYLKQLLDRYKGDVSLALAAYNAGLATVDAAKGIPDIPETRDYVKAILEMVPITPPVPPQSPTPRPTEN